MKQPCQSLISVPMARAAGKKDDIVMINLSGRGDKDVWSAARAMGTEIKL